MVLHQLIDKLEKELELTPEQTFRLTANIKRLIHNEKADVYHRMHLYSTGFPIFAGEGDDRRVVGHEAPDDPFLSGLLQQKFEQHIDMARNYTDEELVTWNVGSHVFKQDIASCTDCATEITPADGYVGSNAVEGFNGQYVNFCIPCGLKRGLIDEKVD